MLTDYDIQRISTAVAEKLLADDRLLKRVVKYLPKKERLLTSSQAATILGVSRYTVCRMAEQLGGVRRPGKDGRGRWMFSETTLVTNYQALKDS